LKFDGAAIHGVADMREAVCDAPQDTTAVVVHRGETAPRTVQLHLQGPAEPIGTQCRSDDADPGCVIISRVLPGSTAERAGLRLNDRIRKVGERTVGSPQQFGALVLGQSGSPSLQIERDGEVRTLRIKLPR
jgi:S1-C subfamily serine protease